MMRQLAGATERSTAEEIKVRVLTDGHDDTANNSDRAKTIKGLAKSFGASPKIRSFKLLGVKPHVRDKIRTWLAPLGSKFRDSRAWNGVVQGFCHSRHRTNPPEFPEGSFV